MSILRSTGYHLPLFPVPEGLSLSDYFEHTVRDGFEFRKAELAKTSAANKLRHAIWEYEQRLIYGNQHDQADGI